MTKPSRGTIRHVQQLHEQGLISAEAIQALTPVVENFSLSITPEVVQLMDNNDANDPIAQQFVPSTAELQLTAAERADPIGDDTHTTVKGIIHRYPDRCLLTPVYVCPVYCRFCYRREKVGSQAGMTPSELDAAYTYIENHPAIWEVILTGGDPLYMKPASMAKIIQRLNAIPHVEVIRIHTRVPVVDPNRINPAMIAALKQGKPVFVVLHANHPNEFSPAAQQACARLVDAGIPMLSQSVLLHQVNDNVTVLTQLMRCFIKNRIKPYYLHQGDLAKGTQHFRTTITHGQTLMKQMRGHVSGICQPLYVLDIPGGHGKVPIGPAYIHPHDEPEHYDIEDYQGQKHHYPPA